MLRAQKYVFRQVAISTVFIVVTLTAVIWLTQSMRFVKFILNKGLALETFLELTALLLPSFILITGPIALFFGTLFTFNKMTNDRELVVYRSSGISNLMIARPVIYVAFIMMALSYSVSLYFMPMAFREFRAMQNDIRNNFSAGLLQEGTFNNLSRGLTIYVRERDGQEMRGLLVQDNRKRDVRTTMMAERGVIVSGEAGSRVVMFDGNRQELDTRSGQLSMLYFEQYSFDIAFLDKKEGATWREPNERYLPQLLYPDNSEADQYYRTKLIAEGHNRLTIPLYTLTMPLLALVIMLTGQFNKRGHTMRLVFGMGVVAVIQGAAIGLLSIAAKVNALIPLMYLNAVVPMLLSLYFLARGRRRGRRLRAVAAE
jgi:lipopolysaccharide export system permease protein